MTYEWVIYVLDALPMAVVLALTATWYLGHIAPATENQSGELQVLNNEPPMDPSARA